MGIEIAFVDGASGATVARSVVEPEQLPETFAISTTVRLGDADWRVVAADPLTRGEIERAGHVRVTVRKQGQVTLVAPKSVAFSMPTICDPLPVPDASVSLADARVFVINEDLWRDVEWVPRRHAAEIEANFSAIGSIRAAASGPFQTIHLRTEPVEPLAGIGVTVADVATMLGPSAEQLDGVVIDTLGAGLAKGGFAFSLAGETHVYGHCSEGGEVAALGVHREGAREQVPAALARMIGVMDVMADADLVVWPYCERVHCLDSVTDWYCSGRACSKMPW
jgi:hypothetical protein